MRLNISLTRTRLILGTLVALGAVGLSTHIASAKRLSSSLSVTDPSCAFVGGNPVVAQATAHLSGGGLAACQAVWAYGSTASIDCTSVFAVRTRSRIGVLQGGGAGAFSQAGFPASATSPLSTTWTGIVSASANFSPGGGCPTQSATSMSWGLN